MQVNSAKDTRQLCLSVAEEDSSVRYEQKECRKMNIMDKGESMTKIIANSILNMLQRLPNRCRIFIYSKWRINLESQRPLQWELILEFIFYKKHFLPALPTLDTSIFTVIFN